MCIYHLLRGCLKMQILRILDLVNQLSPDVKPKVCILNKHPRYFCVVAKSLQCILEKPQTTENEVKIPKTYQAQFPHS